MGLGTACTLTIVIILFAALGLALPITEIVIGAKYLHDCPAEKYLPIYLIVLGVFSMISGSASGPKAAKAARESDDDGSSPASAICNSIILLFLFAWFICGNVWVFRMNECEGKPEPDCFTKDVAYSTNCTSYCQAIVYDFVFYSTIVNWALVGLIAVIASIAGCVMCCS